MEHQKIHLLPANARREITFASSLGNAHDVPEGRDLLRDLGPTPERLRVLVNPLVRAMIPANWFWIWACFPMVPPKTYCVDPCRYGRALFSKLDEIEWIFRRPKRYRWKFSRFQKLDLVSPSFITFAFIVEAVGKG